MAKSERSYAILSVPASTKGMPSAGATSVSPAKAGAIAAAALRTTEKIPAAVARSAAGMMAIV